MTGRKGMKNYPVEVKLEAVRLFYEARKTHAEITEALGIHGAQRTQGFLSGSAQNISVRIITRTVTWAGKAIVFLLNGTTKMCADQAQSGESILVVDEKRRNIGDE